MKRIAMCVCVIMMLVLDLALSAIPVPYLENFDSCVPPALPAGWIAVETNDSNSHASTQANNSHSAPNKVILFEGPGEDDYVVLAMPPVDDEHPFQHISVWWWARAYQANSSLQVGILQDPDDPASFYSLTTDIPLSSYWRQYHLSMALNPGSGRRIAFKSADPAYGGILLDDIELRFNHAVDLELSELQCYDPFQVSDLQSYTARVINQGNSYVSLYNCELLDGSGNILSQSTNGNLDSGYLQSTSFDFAISTPGNHKISARVSLPGDLNPDNDSSELKIVRVLPNGAQEHAAPYTAQYSGKFPIDLYWKTSLSQTLYPASEMTEEHKLIWGLKYSADITSPDIGIKPIKIWMGLTDLPDLSSGWVLASEMQLVFDGENSFPQGEFPSYYCFSEPFHYEAGRNLVIMVLRPMDFRYYTSMDDFACDYTTLQRTRKLESDNTIYDPNSIYGGTLSTARPVTFFYMTDPTSHTEDPLAEAVISDLMAYPNPFNPSTTISFTLDRPGKVRLSIYNVKGQIVNTLVDDLLDSGSHKQIWSGMDSAGNALSSGMYLYRLIYNGHSETRKLMLIK